MYHLSATNIKFYGKTNKYVHLTDKNMKVGTVCCLCADRHSDWDLFVIVGINEKIVDKKDMCFTDKYELKIVFPRIKMENGSIVMGEEKSLDHPKLNHDSKCQLSNIRQGCCFYCDCGTEESLINDYAETFKPVKDNEGTYQMYTLDLPTEPFIGVCCVAKDDTALNYLDRPIISDYYNKA